MPVWASLNGLLQAPSKNPEREQMMARWTANCLAPQTIVRSEYLPASSSLERYEQELTNLAVEDVRSECRH